MKKAFALILAVLLLAALFPMNIVAQADTVTQKGFYLVNWDRKVQNDTYDYEFVYGMPYTWINSANFDNDTESINIGVYFDSYSTSDLKKAAAGLKEEFDKYPAGARYINLAAMGTVFKDCVKDAIDMEDGVRLVADWVDRFMAEYKAIGGKLDGIAIDLEYNSYTSHYLQSNFCTKTSGGGDPVNLDIMQDIVRNERVYQKIIRPQLVEYQKQGLFTFYTKNINPTTGLPDDLSTAVGPTYSSRVPIPVSEISTINRYDDNGGEANSRSTWSFVMQKYIADCITRAAYDPMVKYFPDAILSDYSIADVYSWNKSMSTSGGTTGTGNKAGNASNGVYYGSQFSEYFWASSSGSKTRKLYYKPVSYNKAVFDPTDPFTRVLYDVNNQKRILLSARDEDGEDAKVNVWVPYFHYANTEKSYGNSAYFTEVMYHLGLTNPEPYFGYIIKSEVQNKGKYYDDEKMGDYFYALEVTDQILTELTRVAGASDRKVIETPMAWNEDYILSGMYAYGRNIWRLTPNTAQISLKDFKQEGDTPTFSVNGVTIKFPQGKIIEDSAIEQVGSCGYWIETPANVTPVVTTSATRYTDNPSFSETFDNYKLGEFVGSSTSMLKTTSGRPDTYWTTNGTLEIKASNSNQHIALKGDAELINSIIPKNITAGDSYAKQQAWEVKVTLPASDKYSEVKLFTFEDESKNTTGVVDTFVLADGQAKYAQFGSKTAIENVDLSAGGTYTFKLVLDLCTPYAYTASYYVYDEAGALLGSAEKVSLNVLDLVLPVYKITISTTGASSAVAIDDYKLYPVGLTTQLDLYETVRGRKITNPSAARTEDTAYRFVWMNATAETQTAKIYNAKTGEVYKTVELAPGTDGVLTDLVHAADGTELLISLEVIDPNATTPDTPGDAEGDNTQPGENPGTTGNENTDGTNDAQTPTTPADEAPVEKKKISGGVIALVVCVVLAGAGAAVYFFVVKPKKANTK